MKCINNANGMVRVLVWSVSYEDVGVMRPSTVMMSPKSAAGQSMNSCLWQCSGTQGFESVVP
jgi:hypothetical protein